MNRINKQLPKYCRHKASNQAFVRIGMKMHYLGKYGSAASRQEYDRLTPNIALSGILRIGDVELNAYVATEGISGSSSNIT